MKILNLTRHPINVHAWKDDPSLGVMTRTVTIDPHPDGPAFVRFEDRPIHIVPVGLGWNVDVMGRDHHSIQGVPDPQPGVFLVVSAPVAGHPALRGRRDILVPNRVIKGPTGRIIACESLKPGPGAV